MSHLDKETLARNGADLKKNADAMIAKGRLKAQARVDANWQTIADVDWTDLDHFIGNCRRMKDKESFDTAIAILQALKTQVLGK